MPDTPPDAPRDTPRDTPPDTPRDTPLFRRLWVLCLIVFIDMVGFGVIIPSQPFWTKSFGATAFEIALIMSVYAGCQFVFAFPLGWLSDRVGRKPILILSLCGSVVSFTLVGLAESLLMIVLARALGGVMGANIAVAYAYVADVTSGEERARAMGLLGASIGAGFVLGPFIGGAVAGPDPANPGQIGFFVGAAISAVAVIAAIPLLKEPASHRSNAETGSFRGRLRGFALTLSIPVVLIPIAVAGMAGLAMTGLEATYALWVNEVHGWGARETGLFFGYIGVVLVVVQASLIGPATRLIGERGMLYLGLAFATAGMALVAVSDTVLLVFVNGALIAFGYGFVDPAVSSLVTRNTPAGRQGAVMGVAQSVASLARIAGPAIAGLLFHKLGHNAPYLAGAVILAAALAFAAWRLAGVEMPPSPRARPRDVQSRDVQSQDTQSGTPAEAQARARGRPR